MGRSSVYSKLLDCAVKGSFSEEFVDMLKTSDLLPKTNEGDKQLFSKIPLTSLAVIIISHYAYKLYQKR